VRNGVCLTTTTITHHVQSHTPRPPYIIQKFMPSTPDNLDARQVYNTMLDRALISLP
jgi:hypothetical protein